MLFNDVFQMESQHFSAYNLHACRFDLLHCLEKKEICQGWQGDKSAPFIIIFFFKVTALLELPPPLLVICYVTDRASRSTHTEKSCCAPVYPLIPPSFCRDTLLRSQRAPLHIYYLDGIIIVAQAFSVKLKMGSIPVLKKKIYFFFFTHAQPNCGTDASLMHA